MDGAHDMGGAAGFGTIEPEPNEPMFHHAWERRAFALTLAMAKPGGWNLDMSRFARENRPPADYLSKSYYQLWLAGLETLMRERDLVTPDEIAAGRILQSPKDVEPLLAAAVPDALRRGSPTERSIGASARFRIGNTVRAKTINPPTHTRLPRYVRGRIGVIERVHGCHVFADSHAQGLGEQPQFLYAVTFTARELWGEHADARSRVSVDAWESYLEPA